MRNLPSRRDPLVPEVLSGPLAAFAGYQPEKLDPLVEPLVSGALGAIGVLNQTIPVLEIATAQLCEELQQHARPDVLVLLQRSETVAKIAEKTGKVGHQLIDAVDKLSRLRSFLSGGPDQRVESVEHLSDQELMRVLLAAVGKCPKCGAPLTSESEA